MSTMTSYSPKAKITVTITRDLVRRMDALLGSSGPRSRSRLVEEAIRLWMREQAMDELERQTESYYGSLSEAEREDDRQWSRIAAESAADIWDK